MSIPIEQRRRLPVGAEVQLQGGVHFRVWAPKRRRVEVVLEPGLAVGLEADGRDYFSGSISQAQAGSRYRYRLDGQPYPDPASRFQPDGPHGPSQVIDPSAFSWTDHDWHGVRLSGQVLYEMHIGTFTAEGTWSAATRELPELARLGVTVLEVMPVADFNGRFGWGYDGVNLFAPTRLYGTPDDMRRFIDAAHGLGLGVILDVVYNHVGPNGNYLGQFSPHYFSMRHKTEWGQAINFEEAECGPVREFFLANAAYWIDEFHLDGLRLDATQAIFDSSSDHFLAALSRRVRGAANGRETILIAENTPQQAQVIRPAEQGGYGLDGVWNDDFHNSAHVALTGEGRAYFSDYRGTAQELISTVKRGFLFQGQAHGPKKKPHGSPALDLAPAAFVTFLQNHDQIGNSCHGYRCHLLTSPGKYRALAALLLLGPGTPMLFQGQEFACSRPFFFFADHPPQLAQRVRRGRAAFLNQFPRMAAMGNGSATVDLAAPSTFERCKLDVSERQLHAEVYALHGDLLKLRREEPAFRAQRPGGVDGAVLAPHAFVLRFFAADGDDRLLVVNLGEEVNLGAVAEPLLAPVLGKQWRFQWSSEDPRYGGTAAALDLGTAWRLPAESAGVLRPQPAQTRP